jgi:iron complex outermembrane receptor protein
LAPGSKSPNLDAALASSIGATIRIGPNGAPNFRFPFQNYNVSFNKPLPNAGVSYRLTESNFIYASYAAGFSAPKTDDLYSAPIDAVHPESSDNYAIGYRYETRWLYASINPYYTFYRNRIEATQDPNDPSTSIDRNVGNVNVYGVDFEAGFNPIEHLHLYASANFNKSILQDNYVAATTNSVTGAYVTYTVPSKGKEMLLTPARTFALRGSYDFGPLTFGAQGKYISKRYITDVNDASIGGYAVFGVDARYNLPFFNSKSYVQLNIQNLFDREYWSRAATTQFLSLPVPGGVVIGTPYYYAGAPSTVTLTLNAQF